MILTTPLLLILLILLAGAAVDHVIGWHDNRTRTLPKARKHAKPLSKAKTKPAPK